MFSRIHHVAIICSDYTKSKHFYCEILGLEIIAENYRSKRNSYKLDLALDHQQRIELFSFPNAPQRPSYPEARGLRHLALNVEDIDIAIAHLQRHGVLCEPIRIDEYTGAQYTFFADPDGLPIELYQVN